jgi:hypothetical protein
MITDRNRIYDGWTQLEAGVDAGRASSLIDPNQAVSAENMTFRGGNPTPRPGFRQLTESFTNGDHGFDANGVEIGPRLPVPANLRADYSYKNDVFQTALAYSPHKGDDCIMALTGGRLFKIVPSVNSSRVTEITAKDTHSPYSSIQPPVPHASYRNYKWSPIAYMVQADKWLIAQDGMAKPIIFDSKDAHRSNLETTSDLVEVPVGTMMAYGLGRIVVVVAERDVAFGDLFGSHLDTQSDPADSITLFTERNFLAGGFDAAIPFEQGVATGIQFFPQLDTSTGNGQLLVFAERGAASFNMAIDRLLWQTSQFQILALLTTGMRGHRSIAIPNEDLWFRGDDGYRSFRQARSDSWGWSHIPLSTNVEQFLGSDDGKLLKFASSIYFDNRIIGTCSPVWNVDPVNAWRGRVYHNGMVVVDFNVLSTFGTKYKPTWEGHWTIGTAFTSNLPDIKILQLLTGTFNGVTRAFAFGLDASNQNQLYELSFDDKDDFNGSIPWELVTRSFDFKGGGETNQFTENELYDGDMWITEVSQGGIPPEPSGPSQAQGACCFRPGICRVTTQEECLRLGGTYMGDGTACTPNPCPGGS